VLLAQPADGLRAGHDAVLLAASLPARPGQTVLELGCGAGPVFLCLMARVPDLRVVAVEIDPALADLARANAARNGVADRVTIIQGDVADPALRARLPRADLALSNPPWWPDGTRPPAPLRAGATHEGRADLVDFARTLGASLPHLGAARMILPAARFADGVAALAAAGFGSLALLPLWPVAGRAAKRVILGARKGGRGPARILPGLMLHGPGAAAEPILRDAAALDL
jgi:tRNA1(Val) A37 N6-methylase TrmN6